MKYFVLSALITRITVNVFLISLPNLWTRLEMVYNFPPSQGFRLFRVWVFLSALFFPVRGHGVLRRAEEGHRGGWDRSPAPGLGYIWGTVGKIKILSFWVQ